MAVYISPSFLSPYSSDIVVQGFPRCILWAPRKGYFLGPNIALLGTAPKWIYCHAGCISQLVEVFM